MLMRLLAILLLIVMPSSLCFGQESDVPQEYLVKARYLLNIPLFTETTSRVRDKTNYTICLIGDTPLMSLLESSKGTLIRNLPLEILMLEDLSQMKSCQMLFIASSERHRLQMLLPEAHRQGILTVSDMRDFVRLGGIIGLRNIDNRITFDLNRSAAGKATISFSSHLLKLAHDTIN
jgi:hypothetical protein